MTYVGRYAEVDYKDSQYASPEAWFGEGKPRVAALNALANLPYVIDGDVCVCQSTSVMVYLGEKFGLYGGIRDLELLTEIYDLRSTIIDLVYPFRKINRDQGEFDASVEAHVQKVAPRFYKKLEDYLGRTGTVFLLKDTPSVSDFHLFEMLDQNALIAAKYNHPPPFAPFPKLQNLYEAFKSEPKLAKYFASPAYQLPCNNPLGNAYFA